MASRLGPPKSALASLGCRGEEGGEEGTVGQEGCEHLLPFSSGPGQVCTCMREEVRRIHPSPHEHTCADPSAAGLCLATPPHSHPTHITASETLK